jgi:hypothetical protein
MNMKIYLIKLNYITKLLMYIAIFETQHNPWKAKIGAIVDRWSLFRGSLYYGVFVGRRGGHYTERVVRSDLTEVGNIKNDLDGIKMFYPGKKSTMGKASIP